MRRLLQGRYIFTLLAFTANLLNLLGRDSLRLAILPMKAELELSLTEVSHVLGGYNYGMVATMLAGGPLADILGGKWLVVVVTLLSALSTLLVPLLADLSVAALVVSQAESSSLIGPEISDTELSLVQRYQILSSHWSRDIRY